MEFLGYTWKLTASAFKTVEGWESAGGILVSFFWPAIQEWLGVTSTPSIPPEAWSWIRIALVVIFLLLMFRAAHALQKEEAARADPDKQWDDLNAALDQGMKILARGRELSGAYATSQDPETRRGYIVELESIADQVRTLSINHFPKSEGAKLNAIEIEQNADHREHRLFNAQMTTLGTILAMGIARLQNSKK